jgi:putative peptidoglycan lipid II flippase
MKRPPAKAGGLFISYCKRFDRARVVMKEAMETPEESSSQAAAGIGKAGAIMMASLLLSRILGLVRDSIITGQFEIGKYTDAYRLAFQLPDMIFFLVSGGALSSAFIPVFSEYWHTGRQKEAWKTFSGVLTIISVVLLFVIFLTGVFAEPLFRGLLARNYEHPEIYPLIATMSRILLPAQFAFFIGGLMMGTLYARKVFSIPGLGPNIYNIGIILGAVLISQFVTPGVIGMCWGATFGAIVGNLVVPLIAIKKLGMDFQPSFDFRHEGVRRVFKLMLPVILGLSLPSVFGMIMQAYASRFSPGTNSVLDLSNKIMQAPLGIFGQSLAIAVFPVLTQFYAQERMDLFRKQLDNTMKTVIYLAIPASVLLAIMAPQIVAALYQHGKFTSENTIKTAECLRLFSIGIWAWCLHPVLMRAYYSIQDTVTPIVIGTLTTVFFFLLTTVLINTPLSYRALPLAGSIAPMLMVLGMAWVLAPKVGGVDIRSVATTLGKSLVGATGVVLIAGLIAWTPLAAVASASKINVLLFTGFGFLLSMWAYYFITKALKMPETAYMDRAMTRINKFARK